MVKGEVVRTVNAARDCVYSLFSLTAAVQANQDTEGLILPVGHQHHPRHHPENPVSSVTYPDMVVTFQMVGTYG